MSQFIKNVFASCLGVSLALLLFFFLGIFVFGALLGSAGKKSVSVSDNSILHLKFDHQVPEQTNNVESSGLEAFKDDDVLGLKDVLNLLEHAASDENIKGVYINPEGGLGMGLATADTYRRALEKFKESGKYVIANSKNYTQGAYYLASVADQVYVNPLGSVEFHGFSAMIPFFKDMLDKIGVKMEVFYAGDFKSGSEPFRLNKMTENNRLQMREFLEPVYQNYLADIGKSRKLEVATLRSISDGLKVRNADDAVSLGLVDKVGYVDEVISDFKQHFGLKEADKINVITLEDYALG
ncbi:MAG: S49 family peptidase [Saprospiraceae bacterium]|nr:S49 family peptidase [Saprospiraceae bacterium]